MRSKTVQRLKCALCGRWSEGEAEGWRAYRNDDLTDAQPLEIVFFCPDCADREFGQTHS
jgi:hypothetical protein